jgi:hypothetical protein
MFDGHILYKGKYVRIAPKDNWKATTDPTPQDYDGYSPGSQWFNHATGRLWVCKAINGNAAVWTVMRGIAENSFVIDDEKYLWRMEANSSGGLRFVYWQAE